MNQHTARAVAVFAITAVAALTAPLLFAPAPASSAKAAPAKPYVPPKTP